MGEYLTELPLTFNSVTGNFYCTNNELTTLKGCPKYVGGSFICTYNKLTDNYCDSNIGGYFFTTLKQDGLNISNSCRFNNYKEFQLIQKRKRILGKILI